MPKKLFIGICILKIIALALAFKPNDSTITQRQKIISSLSQELFIKNFILIKQSSFSVNPKIISFTKELSLLNIYNSFLTSKEIKSLINDSKTPFLKSLISTFNENFNDLIYEIISEDERGMSRFLWLVWGRKNESEVENGGFYIPYNSQLLVAEDEIEENGKVSYISEIYHPRIFSPVLFKRHFGVWTENEGIEIPEKDLYKRRFDMNKTQLNVLVDPNTITTEWWDFVNVTSIAMNFRARGILKSQWLIRTKEAQKQDPFELDLSGTVFDHTATINQAEIFGLLWKISGHMYVRYDEILINQDIGTYTRPFTKQLWTGIFICIILVGTCTLFLVYKGISDFGFMNACFHPLEAFINQDGSDAPTSLSIRIIIISTRFVALFIVPTYMGFLLTYILLPNIKLPFTDIEGFVRDGSYKLGYAPENRLDRWFNKTNDPWLQTAYRNHSLDPSELPTHLEMIKRVCEDKKVAYIIYGFMAPLIQCEVMKIPIPITTGWRSLFLRKKSSYGKIFNRIFLMIASTGTLDKYEQKYYWLQFRMKKSQVADEIAPVKFEMIAPAMQLMAILYTFSILMLFLEHLYKRYDFSQRFEKFTQNQWTDSGQNRRAINEEIRRPITS